MENNKKSSKGDSFDLMIECLDELSTEMKNIRNSMEVLIEHLVALTTSNEELLFNQQDKEDIELEVKLSLDEDGKTTRYLN